MLIFAAIVAFACAFGTFWFVKQRRRQQERFMQKSNRRAVEEISAALIKNDLAYDFLIGAYMSPLKNSTVFQ